MQWHPHMCTLLQDSTTSVVHVTYILTAPNVAVLHAGQCTITWLHCPTVPLRDSHLTSAKDRPCPTHGCTCVGSALLFVVCCTCFLHFPLAQRQHPHSHCHWDGWGPPTFSSIFSSVYRLAGNFDRKIFWWIAEIITLGRIYFGGWESLAIMIFIAK